MREVRMVFPTREEWLDPSLDTLLLRREYAMPEYVGGVHVRRSTSANRHAVNRGEPRAGRDG